MKARARRVGDHMAATNIIRVGSLSSPQATMAAT